MARASIGCLLSAAVVARRGPLAPTPAATLALPADGVRPAQCHKHCASITPRIEARERVLQARLDGWDIRDKLVNIGLYSSVSSSAFMFNRSGGAISKASKPLGLGLRFGHYAYSSYSSRYKLL